MSSRDFRGSLDTAQNGCELFSILRERCIFIAPKKVRCRGRLILDMTKVIQSLTTSRRRSGDFMKKLKKSKRAVILTVKGNAAAVVQDAEAY